MEANLTYYKISVNFCQIAYLESGSSNQSQGCSLDLLLKVSMENKSIMLWDSSGVKESNQSIVFEQMMRYLKDKS